MTAVTRAELAKMTCLTKGQVFNRLKQAGLRPVRQGSIGYKGNNPSLYDEDEAMAILQPYAEKARRATEGLLTVAQIAQRHGVTRQSVEAKLQRWGVHPVTAGGRGRGNSRLYDAAEVDIAMAFHLPGTSFWETSVEGSYTLDEEGLQVLRITPKDGITYIRSLTSLWADAAQAFRNDPSYVVAIMEDARDLLDGAAA